MTKEQALEIVKKAEAEYDPHNKYENMTRLLGSITGWDYYKSSYDDRGNRWQQYHDGMGCIEEASSEEVASLLAWQINNVENLLFVVGR